MQDLVNGRLYQRPERVQQYKKVAVAPPEMTILLRHRDRIVDKRLLEIGCGAGRLAAYLGPSSHYVGLDISPHMIAHCRTAYPGLDFVEGDLRAPQFADATFDTIVAISNVVDAVSHADRLAALAEWSRVLVPGGTLIFSTHNRHHPVERPVLERSRNPLRQVRFGIEYLQALLNHARLRGHERSEHDYELRNDPGHEFSVLHYYIDRATQERQLEAAGFEVLDCIDVAGVSLAPTEDDRASTELHFVAQRRWAH
jgi:SAM-dependent methyltransferase